MVIRQDLAALLNDEAAARLRSKRRRVGQARRAIVKRIGVGWRTPASRRRFAAAGGGFDVHHRRIDALGHVGEIHQAAGGSGRQRGGAHNSRSRLRGRPLRLRRRWCGRHRACDDESNHEGHHRRERKRDEGKGTGHKQLPASSCELPAAEFCWQRTGGRSKLHYRPRSERNAASSRI